MKNSKVLLAILDGWGKGQKKEADAIYHADTPCYNHLLTHYPNANLVTYGMDVGLPEGQMGNSEVGHLNIGAGRIVYQELARINKAIAEATIMQEPEIQAAIDYAKKNDKNVHFLGLLSDGGVHAHIDHIIALSKGFSGAGVKAVKIHAFMDGRDTDPEGGAGYVDQLLKGIEGTSASLASMVGRYYAMDRDNRWERIKKAYDLIVNGVGEMGASPTEALQQSYKEGITDEFIEPHLFDKDGTIKTGDVVFFVNFRTDRPRQITAALTQLNFPEQKMKKLDLYFLTMTEYNKSFENIHVVYMKDHLAHTMGEVLEKAGKTQVRIAETEKYPHVTFFFSGGREEAFNGEHRILIPSPKVATYDLAPEMSAEKITSEIVSYIDAEKPDFICLNYANADMVGHTGDFEAAKKAVNTVDTCLRTLVDTALGHDYDIIVIADHGNSDFMINDDGSPNTAHTTNMVPVIYVTNDNIDHTKLDDGKLADIAPTILSLMGITPSEDMTGNILISQ